VSQDNPWPLVVRFSEVARFTAADPLVRHLEPGKPDRAAIAAELGLEGLGALEADVRLSGWRDGLRIESHWRATISQICGVSLDPFESPISGDFTVDVVPAGSPHAPQEVAIELDIDPEADDPPDVVEADRVDVSAYLIEHLALEIDPFPRKPGAVFEPPAEPPEASPFAVLRAIRPTDG
jgi:hypothetical protein